MSTARTPTSCRGRGSSSRRETAEPDWRVFRVTSRAELSRSQFAVSGRITRLGLEGPDDMEFGTPRDALVYAVPELLDLQEVPDLSPVAESSFWIEGDAADMAPGRGIVLVGTQSGEPVADELEIEEATRAGGRTRLTLTDDARPQLRPAEHGRVRQRGARHPRRDGGAAARFGRCTRCRSRPSRLAQGPLTFVPADRRPAVPLRRSRCESTRCAWTEVPTTAIAGDRDRVFMTRDEPGGGLSVVFGDGTHGERPPTGLEQPPRAATASESGPRGNVGRRRALDAARSAVGPQSRDQPAAGGGRCGPRARVERAAIDPDPRADPRPGGVAAGLRRLRPAPSPESAWPRPCSLPRGGGAVVACRWRMPMGCPPLQRLWSGSMTSSPATAIRRRGISWSPAGRRRSASG